MMKKEKLLGLCGPMTEVFEIDENYPQDKKEREGEIHYRIGFHFHSPFTGT